MSRCAWILLTLALVLAGGTITTIWFLLHYGFSAKDRPMGIEVTIARYLRHLAVPEAQREMKNPVPATEEVLAEAQHHFADHCAYCHANDGSGSTLIGKNFYPRVPDMRTSETQSLSDGELFYTIHNGIRFTGMPAWGKGRPERDLDSWKLVHFIRHLPNITHEELEEMERYNPISRVEWEEQQEIERFLLGEKSDSVSSPQHH